MTRRFTFAAHPGDGARFTPGCFDGSIGTEVALTIEGVPAGRAVIVAAEVEPDGTAARITYEPVEPDEA